MASILSPTSGKALARMVGVTIEAAGSIRGLATG
jgi:hypothetical protein